MKYITENILVTTINEKDDNIDICQKFVNAVDNGLVKGQFLTDIGVSLVEAEIDEIIDAIKKAEQLEVNWSKLKENTVLQFNDELYYIFDSYEDDEVVLLNVNTTEGEIREYFYIDVDDVDHLILRPITE